MSVCLHVLYDACFIHLVVFDTGDVHDAGLHHPMYAVGWYLGAANWMKTWIVKNALDCLFIHIYTFE